MQKLPAAIFLLVGLPVKPFLATIDQGQRASLVGKFNDSADRDAMVLVCSFMVSLAGYNLQEACCYVHIFDPPTSEAARVQVIGRTFRLGQKRTVVIIS